MYRLINKYYQPKKCLIKNKQVIYRNKNYCTTNNKNIQTFLTPFYS